MAKDTLFVIKYILAMALCERNAHYSYDVTIGVGELNEPPVYDCARTHDVTYAASLSRDVTQPSRDVTTVIARCITVITRCITVIARCVTVIARCITVVARCVTVIA